MRPVFFSRTGSPSSSPVRQGEGGRALPQMRAARPLPAPFASELRRPVFFSSGIRRCLGARSASGKQQLVAAAPKLRPAAWVSWREEDVKKSSQFSISGYIHPNVNWICLSHEIPSSNFIQIQTMVLVL
ncbi:hypothetical protein SETIT_4G198100v2 [Setaria italica]|uniref:Uncharacterized protein n=1 Tax=Setaria italica TaxID=4555 RepID=K3Y003_SETIT|nr:hypothetical protein SETIT_4G198100v2 [Setaria italica]